jgi:hypothetical protein
MGVLKWIASLQPLIPAKAGPRSYGSRPKDDLSRNLENDALYDLGPGLRRDERGGFY